MQGGEIILWRKRLVSDAIIFSPVPYSRKLLRRNIKETVTAHKTSAEAKSNDKNQACLCFCSLNKLRDE